MSIMKIAVIAADGRTGRLVVQAALQGGYEVYAGVRGVHQLTESSMLHVINCDATNREDVERLISRADAVVSMIGHVPHSPPDVQTRAMKTIIGAMHAKGIVRLVSLTGTGVRLNGDKITLADRVLNLGISVIDPARVRDGRDHAKLLQDSDLEWTLLRVLKLQETSPRGYRLTPHGPTRLYVSRQDVAAAVLEVLSRHSFVRQAPILSAPTL